MSRLRLAALAAAVVAALGATGGYLLVSPGSSSGSSPTTLTGSINLTCSQGGCANFSALYLNQPLDLDSITIDCDLRLAANGKGYDCLKLGPLATGRVGKLILHDVSEDGVKVTGAHDLSVGGQGSTITIDGLSSPLDHQDGIQVLSGSNVTFEGVVVRCSTCTNAQLYVNPPNGGVKPEHIYFMDGELFPDPTHFNNVVLNGSVESGVINSVICPDARPDPFQIGPNAVDPVNVDNTFPSSCS